MAGLLPKGVNAPLQAPPPMLTHYHTRSIPDLEGVEVEAVLEIMELPLFPSSHAP